MARTTKLDDEKLKEKKLHEEAELVEAIGKQGKEGVKEAKKAFKKIEKEEKEKEAVEHTILKESSRSFSTYNELLAKLLIKRLRLIRYPEGWKCNVVPTAKGIVMELSSPDKRYFRSAFSTTMDAILDLNAVDVFGERAEMTIEKYEYERRNTVKNGTNQ